jgi:P-type Cu+ transporter
MNVDERKADAVSSQHGGKTYYFCSPGCQQKFRQQPDQYAKSA